MFYKKNWSFALTSRDASLLLLLPHVAAVSNFTSQCITCVDNGCVWCKTSSGSDLCSCFNQTCALSDSTNIAEVLDSKVDCVFYFSGGEVVLIPVFIGLLLLCCFCYTRVTGFREKCKKQLVEQASKEIIHSNRDIIEAEVVVVTEQLPNLPTAARVGNSGEATTPEPLPLAETQETNFP